MPELSHKHRLQPSLLDRLIDDAPAAREEARDARACNAAQLRDSVRRDLSSLFNATRLEASCDLRHFPLAQSSTLNYGITDLAGATLSSVDLGRLAQLLREAITRFEPRLNPRTLQLRPRVARGAHGRNAIVFDIEAELFAYPIPIELYLRSEFDLESGNVSVSQATPERS
jgi:type VI secretion system protein ImpF